MHPHKYWVICDLCGTRYLMSCEREGRKGRCRCGHSFVLPYTDIASFAKKAPLEKVSRFLDKQTRRDCASTHQLVTRIFKNRYAEAVKLWKQERHSGIKCVADLLRLSPVDFEAFVAQLYVNKGYKANCVGGSADGGVDVEIYASNGTQLWAIAQCKRYKVNNKIGAAAIRDFAGAFIAGEAQQGLFFTTSAFTRLAISTAARYRWLTLYDGPQIIRLIQSTEIGL